MDLVFATNNKHKLKEISTALSGSKFNIVGLSRLNINEDIPETGTTLEDNAKQKAEYIYSKYGYNCFADDTGLEVTALNNEPGVYSARYAGVNCSFEDNVNKLLYTLGDSSERSACFRTIICLVLQGKYYSFEGKAEGTITKKPLGEEGFGYDPIFQPIGYNKTFAEMALDEKNKISHRTMALHKLINFLRTK